MLYIRIFALLTTILVGACTSVDAEKIARFGGSAAALGVALEETRNIQNNLKEKIDIELEATNYVRGSHNFAYPPPKRKSLSVGSGWNSRINFATALAAYGSTLAEAAKGSKEAGIGEAVDGLHKAVVTAIPGVAGQKNAAVVGNSAARLLFREASLQSVREAIVVADPFIRDGAKLLEIDLAFLSDQAGVRFNSWTKSKRAALIAFQSNSRASPVERYNMYKQFASEEREVAAAVALLVGLDGGQPRYKALLSTMVAAHSALLKPDASSVALDDFIKSVDELAEIFSSLKGDV